ncbi:hypothetical protein U1Q18_024850 [Sarracenia purpurea var. burkii]
MPTDTQHHVIFFGKSLETSDLFWTMMVGPTICVDSRTTEKEDLEVGYVLIYTEHIDTIHQNCELKVFLFWVWFALLAVALGIVDFVECLGYGVLQSTWIKSSTGVIQSNAFVQGFFKSNAHVLHLYDRLAMVNIVACGVVAFHGSVDSLWACAVLVSRALLFVESYFAGHVFGSNFALLLAYGVAEAWMLRVAMELLYGGAAIPQELALAHGVARHFAAGILLSNGCQLVAMGY